MDISSDQHNEAMAKFLVSRYERVVGWISAVGQPARQTEDVPTSLPGVF